MCEARAGGEESEVGVVAGAAGQTLRLQEAVGGRARSQGWAGWVQSRTADWALRFWAKLSRHRLWTQCRDGSGHRPYGPGCWTGSGKEPHPPPGALRDMCADWGSPQPGAGQGDKGPHRPGSPAQCSCLPPPGGLCRKNTRKPPGWGEGAGSALLPKDVGQTSTGGTGQQLKCQGLRGEKVQT